VANLERAIDDLRRKWVPDPRLGIFDVTLARAPQQISGVTTSGDARDALRRLARDAGIPSDVRLLPEDADADPAVIVTAALAPLFAEPKLVAARASEALHGEMLEILEQHDEWLRVRASDGYIAWLHSGYAMTGPAEWAEDWIERAKARSISAEIQTRTGRRRLPTGARVVLRRRDGSVELADGERGIVVSGTVRLETELRVEARHLALPELAQRLYGGAPYLWGGRTEWGIDCSGLVQAVYGARRIQLPRDSDQQFAVGREIKISSDGKNYEGGDLMFFAERGRVSHVALWAGAGRVVHAALARGGVGSDHLFGDEPRMKRLRENLVGVRRLGG
jgi:hypothetical protein